MKVNEQIVERFNNLTSMGDRVLTTRVRLRASPISPGRNYAVDTKLSTEWGVLCLNLISSIFTKNSDHYQKFDQYFGDSSKFDAIEKCVGVLHAAKSDYQNGYLNKVTSLIEAEIFSDILEQAEELLKKGHYQASAVVAGCVLEDGLRKLCHKNNISFPKKPTIEPMNVELAKIGIYNQFIKDKVSSIGKLRNHAAHGEWTEFTEKDVEDMIRDVRRFMEDYFS